MSFDALTHPLRGRHSIEASAGTGKTYSITLLWLRLLVEEQLTVEQILVSTFTKAATAELRERLLHALRNARSAALALESGAPLPSGPEATIVSQRCVQNEEPAAALRARLTQALSRFDLAPILTIHGFCQQLIARHAVELACDANLTLRENADALLRPLVDDQLMQLSEHTRFEVAPLRAIADQVALNPAAELLLPPGNASAQKHAALQQILAEAPVALTKISHSGVRAKVERQVQVAGETGAWEKFSDAAVRSLPPEFVELWDRYNAWKTLEDKQSSAKVASAVSSLFPVRKNAEGVRTFDDLILTVRHALESQGGDGVLAQAVRTQLQAAIIDECQDSDGAQIEVFEKLFLHSSVISFLMIGDPKQSIYRFRGADLASYKRLVSRTEPAKPMSTNWRSDQPLIEALNQMYDGHVFPDTLLPDQQTRYLPVDASAESRINDPGVQSPLVFQWSPETKSEDAKTHVAELVAAECVRLLSTGVQIIDRHAGHTRALHAGDIAVLAANRRQLSLIRRFLNRAFIPSQSPGKSLGSVFCSPEAQDVLAWLEMLNAIERRHHALPRLLAFLGNPLGGKTAGEIVSLSQDTASQAREYGRFLQQISSLRRQGPLPLLMERMADNKISRINLGHADGERRMTNWRHLGALLQQEFSRGRRSADALGLWLARHIASGSHAVTDETDSQESALMRLETDASAIQLMTIHASKGLEFPVVFCPFLWAVKSRHHRKQTPVARFRRTAGWALDVGSPALASHLETALGQEDEEEHRKLYVALTRARHRLYIGLAPVREGRSGYANGAANSPLVRLPGLGLADADTATWATTLGALTFAHLQTAPLSASPTLSPTPPASGSDSPALIAPPQAPSYPFLLSRKSSFSSLSKSESEHFSIADHDGDVAPMEATASQEKPDVLSALNEKGAALGDRLHAILEDYLGNCRPLEHALRNCPQPETWRAALEVILHTGIPLPTGERVTLETLRGRCITEMQFQLPLVQLNPEMLGEVLLQDPAIREKEDRRAWAQHIQAHWKFGDFGGFLQGYIDLLFEHEGRWFVADYKSNRLDGYGEVALEHAMGEHHYLLQARLYVLALHRHLRAHLPDYDYEKHVGGVFYLFVREFRDEGIWFERPTRDALRHLENLFIPAQP